MCSKRLLSMAFRESGKMVVLTTICRSMLCTLQTERATIAINMLEVPCQLLNSGTHRNWTLQFADLGLHILRATGCPTYQFLGSARVFPLSVKESAVVAIIK